MKISFSKKYTIPSLFFLVMLIIQWYGVGKQLNPFTDEGVYLYDAKLILEGYIPYKDFFLAHPPFLIYLLSLSLSILHFNLNIFHYIYTVWVLTCIFPLYFVTYRFTKSNFAAAFALLLFCSYPEFQRYDVHTFGLRQASLPFFSFSLLFLINTQLKKAAFLLALFSISLVSNIPFTFVFLCLYLLYTEKKILLDFSKLFRKYKSFITVYALVFIAGYLPIVLIPRALDNTVLYQIHRPVLDYGMRSFLLYFFFWDNFPIYLFGFLGVFVKNNMARMFSLLSIISFFILGFLYKVFYFDYFSILAIPLTIGAGITIHVFSPTYIRKLVMAALLITCCLLMTYPSIVYHLITRRFPHDYQIISELKNTKEPLFTFQPIYGIMANKNLVFDYHVADMRYYDIVSEKYDLSQDEYIELIKKSNTVFLEDIFATKHIKGKSYEYLRKNFNLKFKNSVGEIYEKKFTEHSFFP